MRRTCSPIKNFPACAAQAWADSPDPAVGWCNVNNPSVIQGWIDRWKK